MQRRLEPPPHVKHDPRMISAGGDRLEDQVPRDSVEEFHDVQVDDPVRLPAAPAALAHRVDRGPAGTVAVGVRMEDRLGLRLQYPRDDRLGDPVPYRWYA